MVRVGGQGRSDRLLLVSPPRAQSSLLSPLRSAQHGLPARVHHERCKHLGETPRCCCCYCCCCCSLSEEALSYCSSRFTFILFAADGTRMVGALTFNMYSELLVWATDLHSRTFVQICVTVSANFDVGSAKLAHDATASMVPKGRPKGSNQERASWAQIIPPDWPRKCSSSPCGWHRDARLQSTQRCTRKGGQEAAQGASRIGRTCWATRLRKPTMVDA